MIGAVVATGHGRMSKPDHRILPWLACAAWALILASCGDPAPTTTPAADTAQATQDTQSGPEASGKDSAAETAGKDGTSDGKASDSSDAIDGQGEDTADSGASDDVADADPLKDSQDDGDADTGSTDSGGSEVSAVDASPDTASPIVKGEYPSTCATAADCINGCSAPGSSCDAGKCKFTLKPGACLHDIGGGKVECLGAGDTSAKTPCLACQVGPKGAVMSANLWIKNLDAVGEGVDILDIYKTGVTWNYSKKRSISGGAALYFGDPVKATYNNNKQVGGTATLPKADVPDKPGLKPKLGFWLWLDTEETAGDDLLTVLVLDNGTPTKVWTSDAIGGSTNGAWQRISVEIGQFAGKNVQFQFAFETKDGALNAFEGAYIDDVAIATGCCASNAECDDANACSTDVCKPDNTGNPVCSHDTKADCCSTAADCDDKKPCTLDLCSAPGGTCSHSDLPNCCLSAADCDDKNDCTADTCPAAGGSCKHQNTCCKSDSECATGDPCKKGVCAGGSCAYTDTCCSLDEDCDDFNPCTKDACDKGKCAYTAAAVPGCCAPNILTSSFAGNDEGFQTVSEKPELSWAYLDLANAHSAPGALHMGLPSGAAMNVANTSLWKVTTTTPAFTVLQGKETTLSFWAYAPAGAYTSFTLRAYATIDGTDINFANISGFTILNAWKQFTFDLTPLGGKSFAVKFEYKCSSSFGNTTGPGIYLDDVTVLTTCKSKACTSVANCPTTGVTCLAGVCSDGACSYANSCCKDASECNDNSLCTADTCTGSKCAFTAIKGCCMGPGDCNDNNACTTDVCPQPGAQCSNPAIPGCCLSSAQCDDKNACTVDYCIGNKCQNNTLCCTADKDCDDGETKCTVDKCVSGKCTHAPTNAPGCCNPDVWVNDFDGGDPMGLTFSNSGGAAKGWQLTTKQPTGLAKTPPGVLYYGDPNTGNFDFGANNGTATTQKILLPATTASKLTFDVFMDTEGGGEGSFDDLYCYVLVNGQKVKAWSKSTSGFSIGAWFAASFDLTAYQGQEIQVQFTFDTKDSIGNGGKGVFVDNLKLTTNCGG